MSAQSEPVYVKELTHTICFYDIYISHSDFIEFRDTVQLFNVDWFTTFLSEWYSRKLGQLNPQ